MSIETRWAPTHECEIYEQHRYIIIADDGVVDSGVGRYGTVYGATHVLVDEDGDPIELPPWGSAND